MTLRGAAVVPAAPLMLPEVSPGQPAHLRGAVAALRADARAAIGGLPDADVVVLLAGHPGATPGAPPATVHGTARASMRPLGTDLVADLDVPADLAVAVAAAAGCALDADDPLGPDHAVLALLVRAVRGDTPVLPVAVPPAAAAADLVALGARLVAALRDHAATATVVCCGDLATGLRPGGPGDVIAAAGRWDAAVMRACAGGDLADLPDAGPAEAVRVGARGWAPLVVLHGACRAAGLRPVRATYRAPLGVGQLVARCVPVPTDPDGVPAAPRPARIP